MPTTAKKAKKNPQDLRWGFSTGASMSALALCAWHNLQYKSHLAPVPVYFLDGCERLVPVLSQKECEKLAECAKLNEIEFLEGDNCENSAIVALHKDGGDDPDCTHRALIYAKLSKASLNDAQECDYILSINNATLIIHCVEGIGLCTREGLDCEQGKWAITHGPRNMLRENLSKANMTDGVWRLQIGVKRGQKLAKNTLNPLLGVIDGISLLGTTGLVRPYSHEAYLHTIQVCVKAHALSCKKAHIQSTEMVFCTGGRTKTGAQNHLASLPETAFTPIGDFIAESLKIACQYDMQTITVACMAGKLCKYAAGFSNTHAHRVQQDMDLLRAELRKCLPENHPEFCDALANAPSVREALLFIPEEIRLPLLEQLALKALEQFRVWCGARPQVKLLIFDFAGTFLFEKHIAGDSHAKPLFDSIDMEHIPNSFDTHTFEEDTQHTDSRRVVGRSYFLEKQASQKNTMESDSIQSDSIEENTAKENTGKGAMLA